VNNELKQQWLDLAQVATWLAEGREVECRKRIPQNDASNVRREWEAITPHAAWLVAELEYRLKPEPKKPREWWIVGSYPHTSLEVAQHWAKHHRAPIIHVREVVA